MTDDTPPLKAKLQQLKHNLQQTPLQHHLQSTVISLGLVLVGVAVGVKWSAVTTIPIVGCRLTTNTCSQLAAAYNHQMKLALGSALISILAGLYLIQHTETGDD